MEKKVNVNNILESDIVQRAYDGKWERVVKVMDHENSYTYQNESGRSVTYTPEKWITVAVYDALLEFN